MVSANSVTTILKARFGNDVRRKSIHHGNDLTLNDLALMLQRVFSISSTDIQLKYRDSEGDFITIADDTDLLLALHESTLFIEVIVGAEPNTSDLFQQIQKIQEDVGKLSILANSLLGAQTGREKIHKQTEYTPLSSPVERSEVPTSIQPSHHEEANSHDDQVTSTSDVSSPLDQEIPLEADKQNSSMLAQEPHVHFAAPPTAPIPQFPTSNAPAPNQSESRYNFPPPGNFAPTPSLFQQPSQQQFNAPHQFAPPPPNAPTLIQPEAQYGFPGSVPGAPGHFAPPPSPYQHQPSQFVPPQQQYNAPGQFVAQQQMGGLPMNGPPPMGAGMLGQNPFAKGPAGPYRQSPYHQ